MLTVDNIFTSYGKVQALTEVSFVVPSKKIITLLGSNGAGKSTTMKTIMGLLKITQGSIRFEDKRIDNSSTAEIVKIGICLVPEGRELFLEMTVLDNLIIGAYIRKSKKEIKKDIDLLLTYFPILKDRQRQLAGTLSGGEQQMLAIARGLMIRPKLLLLDEPSLGLAPILVNEIFNIIQEINHQGTTILLVEQNAHMALSVSEHAYILETGKIAIAGKSEDLIANEDVKKTYLGE